jgi:hypothetical protein
MFISIRMSLGPQQGSGIRYYCLHQTKNAQIRDKLEQTDQEDVLRIRAVEKVVSRFQSGQNTVEDKERSRRTASNDFHDTVLRFLQKQTDALFREIRKALSAPKTIILRVLHDLGLFAPR